MEQMQTRVIYGTISIDEKQRRRKEPPSRMEPKLSFMRSYRVWDSINMDTSTEWKPATFKSSRSNRATMSRQHVDDFTDNDDTFSKNTLHVSDLFIEVSRNQPSTSRRKHFEDLQQPKMSSGYLLLQKLGWASKLTRNSIKHEEMSSAMRHYGLGFDMKASNPDATDKGSSDEEPEVNYADDKTKYDFELRNKKKKVALFEGFIPPKEVAFTMEFFVFPFVNPPPTNTTMQEALPSTSSLPATVTPKQELVRVSPAEDLATTPKAGSSQDRIEGPRKRRWETLNVQEYQRVSNKLLSYTLADKFASASSDTQLDNYRPPETKPPPKTEKFTRKVSHWKPNNKIFVRFNIAP